MRGLKPVLFAVALLLSASWLMAQAPTRLRPFDFINGAGVPRAPIAYAPQAATLDGVTTFAVTSNYVVLLCTGAETINTITGATAGVVLVIEHADTDCTIADDDAATAADAVDLTGTGNDVGAVNKVITLLYNGVYWQQSAESDN